jgi:hypothetical protein
MMAVIGWGLGIIALWVLGILTIQISRDIGESLPLIGRWLIQRSVRGLPEPAQTEIYATDGSVSPRRYPAAFRRSDGV